MSQQLQQAYQLIRSEQRTEAMQILVQIVREDPNNADAWWLLANAVTNPDQQRRAVEQVLRLRPTDDKAQRLMAKISGAAFTPPAAPARSPYNEPTMVASTPPRPPADPFADPFAQPVAAPPPQRRVEPDPFASADPFGDGTSRPAPAATPARKRKTDDPFDDPFSDPPTNAYPPDRARRMSEVGVPRRRRSGCATCFIIFAVVVAALCGVCIVATIALPSAIRPIFNQVADALSTQSPSSGLQFRNAIDAIYAGDSDAAATALGSFTTGLGTEVALTIAANPDLQNARGTLEAGGQIAPSLQQTLEAASAGIAGLNFSLGGGNANAVDRGAIEIGQTVRDTLPAGNNGFRYRLTGVRSNETLMLTATADNNLDVVIEVYLAGDSTRTVADLDGGMSGDTEVLEWTPEQGGDYDVVVRGFAGGAGAFTLEVARQ